MFHPLPHINSKDLPLQFTYPFHYEAHPLCKKAAEKLQEKLNEWQWDRINHGKMFGVLLVQKSNGEVGYLWAYSGNLNEGLKAHYFVPPIYDLLAEDGFFINGEKEITALNLQIEERLNAKDYQSKVSIVEANSRESEQAIEQQRQYNKEAKQQRNERRIAGEKELSPEDFKHLEKQLIRESQQQKADLKRLRQLWAEKFKTATADLHNAEQVINGLKKERQEKSLALQQSLFDQYQLLNAKGEPQGLVPIFKAFNGQQPPAAAGDCAGPRLLQYAYLHQLKPLAMAEFWWGKSPKSIIRKEGNYYPACKGKCKPILEHMLVGLEVQANPLEQEPMVEHIAILLEDKDLLVINKPAGMLSVKGKLEKKSVIEYLHEQRTDLNELHIVHRLDMATSGLILIAKNISIYKQLQQQFILRTIKKRYEAIVDGTIANNKGKIELPLRVDLDNRPQQMVCYEHGKPALTIWKKLEEKDGKTRIAFFPQTGRTHQLRIHAAHPKGLNTPIYGDPLYGSAADRLHLHAASISFTHPHTGQTISVKSEVQF